jgi:hypothetical protein
MSFFSFLQTYADGINALLAVIGAFIALYWWFCKRDRKPRAVLHLEMTDVLIEGSKHYIHVEIILNNVGKVKLKTESGMLWIRQITPLLDPDKITNDPLFARTPNGKSFETPYLIKKDAIKIDNEFEPGESESIYCDEILDKGPQSILIYAFVRDITIPMVRHVPYGFGWSVQKIFTLRN